MLDKADQPTLTDLIEKGSNVRVENEVHTLGGDSDDQRVQRIVLAALGTESVAEPEELLLVDAVQHGRGRSLNNLVLECRHRQGALFPIGLRNVRPARWQRPVRSAVDPGMQISEVSVKVCCIGLPCQPLHAGGGFACERKERVPQQIDVNVVQKRGELLLLPLPCGLPYAIQRM